MRAVYLFILLATGCTYSVREVITTEEASVAEPQREPPVQPTYDLVRDAGADVCVPETFAADQIPYDFQYDINCPPNIYAPPRWIPPWDPSPIIQNKVGAL